MSGRLTSMSVGAALAAVLGSACLYRLAPGKGGAEKDVEGPRRVRAADVLLPPGYRAEVVATGLTFPTGVAFDDRNRPWVIEAGYSYGEVFLDPRLLRVEPGGRVVEVARGARNGPWNGVAFGDGAFFVAEGGQLEGGRILRITPDGDVRVLVADLPGKGDHHTNGPVIGPDGWIYFGQGTATNSGVVGEDNARFGWLRRFPEFHDVPCEDVVLTGRNFRTRDPLRDRADEEVSTGAYVPFATPTEAGQIVKGSVPCGGAILRVRPEGGVPELVAWGFRNPFGLAFDAEGALWVTENGFDIRGSRPVFGAPDVLWRVQRGAWHGWPDFAAGEPLDDARWAPPGGPRPEPLLARHPNPPPRPAAVFAVNSSTNGLDFSRSERFGHVGQAFVAQFGDMTPQTGKVLEPVGYKVLRVEAGTGVAYDFAVNRAEEKGPASRVGSGGLERPVAVRFDRTGEALYVVDFGILTIGEKGPQPRPGSGVLWRIVRESGAR